MTQFFTNVKIQSSTLCGKRKAMRVAENTIPNHRTVKVLTIPDSNFYYRVIATEPAWDWRKNRHTDEQNLIQDTAIITHAEIRQSFINTEQVL